MTTQILFGVVIVPAVIGLTEVTKDIGVPSRFAPLIAVLFGILAGLAQTYSGQWQWIQAVVVGVAMGLSAVGLYSGVTSAAGKSSVVSSQVSVLPSAPTAVAVGSQQPSPTNQQPTTNN